MRVFFCGVCALHAFSLEVLYSSFCRTCRFAPCVGVSVVLIECDAWAEDLCGSVVCGLCVLHASFILEVLYSYFC